MWNIEQLEQFNSFGAITAMDTNVIILACAVALALLFFWFGRKSHKGRFQEMHRQNYELRHALAENSLRRYGTRD